MKTALLFIISIILLTSCTSTYYIALEPPFEKDIKTKGLLSTVQPAINFSIGKYTDVRKDDSKLCVFNINIRTFEAYDVPSIKVSIIDGLKYSITSTGHTYTDSTNAQIKIDVKLVDVKYKPNSSSSKTNYVDIELSFFENKTNNLIYKKNYKGYERGEVTLSWETHLKNLYENVIIKCLNKVIDDEKLIDALKKYNLK
jgi:hypothetical protein